MEYRGELANRFKTGDSIKFTFQEDGRVTLAASRKKASIFFLKECGGTVGRSREKDMGEMSRHQVLMVAEIIACVATGGLSRAERQKVNSEEESFMEFKIKRRPKAL